MSFLEYKEKSSARYAYFVKKGFTPWKKYALIKYIGKDTGLFSKEGYMLDNMGTLVEAELDLRKNLWENTKLAYNNELVKNVEKNAILLTNLVEAKNTYPILKKEFAKEFVYNSNNIEGSKIPKERLAELLEKGKTNHSNKNEVLEVENSIRAMDYFDNGFTFNETGIKKLYSILTKDILMEKGMPYPKGFRKIEIIAGEAPTSKPKEIKKEISSLLKWNKTNSKKISPLERAFGFHWRYEAIHPFRDGNGRTGRLLMNKILDQNNYPPIIIYKDNKLAYFNAISAIREGDNKRYYQFMLEQAKKTYEQMIEIIKKV